MAALHIQLLQQAEQQSHEKSPSDAVVRRAISTAYYALFHAITFHASAMFRPEYDNASLVIRRVYSHSAMKQCCVSFAKHTVPEALAQKIGWSKYSPPDEIREIAAAFVFLQELRHRADYDNASELKQDDAKSSVQKATESIEKLRLVTKSHPNDLGLFLLALLLGQHRDA